MGGLTYWVEQETHGHWATGEEAAGMIARAIAIKGEGWRWPRVRHVVTSEALGGAEARRLKRAARDLEAWRTARAAEGRRPEFATSEGPMGRAPTVGDLAARILEAGKLARRHGWTWTAIAPRPAGVTGFCVEGVDREGCQIVAPWRFTTEEGAAVYLAAVHAAAVGVTS